MKLEKVANVVGIFLFVVLALVGIAVYNGLDKSSLRQHIFSSNSLDKPSEITAQSDQHESGLISTPELPPEEINELSLSDHKTGEEVTSELKMMHGESEKIESIKEGHFLKYLSKEGDSISAWIGIIASEDEAKILIDFMAKRIKSSSKFTLRETNIGSDTIYSLAGLGFDDNHFYSKGNKTIWIGVSGKRNLDASEFIKEFNSRLGYY